MGVVVGSTDVSSTVGNATEKAVSSSAEATSDVASGTVAVLESSAIEEGDSDRLVDALGELTTGFVDVVISDVASEVGSSLDAGTISGTAADAEVASSEDEAPTSVADALALVTSVLVYSSSTDAIVVEEDVIGSVSDVLMGSDELADDDVMLVGEADDGTTGMLMVDSTLDGATGAFARVDHWVEDAGLQLPKPGWHPLPQYASVLPLCCISTQQHVMKQSMVKHTSMSIDYSNCPIWTQHKSFQEVTLGRHCRIAHLSKFSGHLVWWRVTKQLQ